MDRARSPLAPPLPLSLALIPRTYPPSARGRQSKVHFRLARRAGNSAPVPRSDLALSHIDLLLLLLLLLLVVGSQ